MCKIGTCRSQDPWDCEECTARDTKDPALHNAEQRKACNNAVKVQCLRCGEWFVNIDGCPNGCRAGVTTAIE